MGGCNHLYCSQSDQKKSDPHIVKTSCLILGGNEFAFSIADGSAEFMPTINLERGKMDPVHEVSSQTILFTKQGKVKMDVTLNTANLKSVPQGVKIPTYNRSELSPGILHFGVGNFPRAHMAHYLEELHERGKGMDWGIIGASLRNSSSRTRDVLKNQNFLYTVVECDTNICNARVMGSLLGFVRIDHAPVLEKLIDPRIRIVSLCITEGAYFIDAKTGGLAVDDPQIRADTEDKDNPQTIFGLIIKALKMRKQQGVEPFTVLSLDNLPGNGDLTKQTVVGLAQLADRAVARWIESHVAFPNCMVDCIVPATSELERNLVAERFGIADEAPVFCEPFRQWVVEDDFPSGRPALEHVGVEFVEDIVPYELMKLRILNAGHASFCYAGALLGFHYGHEAIDDPDLRAWVRALQKREVLRTLKPLPGISYDEYLEKVLVRFSNSEIKDTIARLAFSGSDRQPKFVLPTLRDALAANGPVDGLALEVALWCRYCTCVDEDNNTIELEDIHAAELKRRAIEAIERPGAFLEFSEVFGSLSENTRFLNAFARWLTAIHENGVRATIQKYLKN